MKLTFESERWKLAKTFRISRGSKDYAEVVVATIEDAGFIGRGECVPYARYGETIESTFVELEKAAHKFAQGESIENVLKDMQADAARNALDCAWWDWRCKKEGRRISNLLNSPPLRNVVTAYTISIDEVELMECAAREQAHRPILKIKTGKERVIESVQAVRRGAPRSKLIVDANEAWEVDNVVSLLNELSEMGVAMVEQPLAEKDDDVLKTIQRKIPVFADESFHTSDDVERCVGRYDGVNIKLDKTGGLTEALRTLDAARKSGLRVMCGCMVGTSLGMAPAVVIAQRADYVDLDGPLLLAEDRTEKITYDGSILSSFSSKLWG
jgi:L-alanine-DL-glutamate epimerase-like enolase superfamily enzyme